MPGHPGCDGQPGVKGCDYWVVNVLVGQKPAGLCRLCENQEHHAGAGQRGRAQRTRGVLWGPRNPDPSSTPPRRVIPGRRGPRGRAQRVRGVLGAPESRRSNQNNITSKAGSIQTQSESTPSGGITPKAWIPGPRVLAHASRDDTAVGPSGENGAADVPVCLSPAGTCPKQIKLLRSFAGEDACGSDPAKKTVAQDSDPAKSQNAALECCATAAHRKVDVLVDQKPAGLCRLWQGKYLTDNPHPAQYPFMHCG